MRRYFKEEIIYGEIDDAGTILEYIKDNKYELDVIANRQYLVELKLKLADAMIAFNKYLKDYEE